MDTMKLYSNIYLDVSKTFDILDYNILSKLKLNGISEISHILFASYLIERNQFVQLGAI